MKPNSNDDNDGTPEDKTKRAQQARTRAQNLWDQYYKKSTDPLSKAKAGIPPDRDPLAPFKEMMEKGYKRTDPRNQAKAMLAKTDSAPDSAPNSDPLAFPKAMMEKAYKRTDQRNEAKASLAETGIAPDREPVREQFAQIIALLDPKREFIDILSDNPTARSLLHAS